MYCFFKGCVLVPTRISVNLYRYYPSSFPKPPPLLLLKKTEGRKEKKERKKERDIDL